MLSGEEKVWSSQGRKVSAAEKHRVSAGRCWGPTSGRHWESDTCMAIVIQMKSGLVDCHLWGNKGKMRKENEQEPWGQCLLWHHDLLQCADLVSWCKDHGKACISYLLNPDPVRLPLQHSAPQFTTKQYCRCQTSWCLIPWPISCLPGHLFYRKWTSPLSLLAKIKYRIYNWIISTSVI